MISNAIVVKGKVYFGLFAPSSPPLSISTWATCIHLQTISLPFLISIFYNQGAKAAQKRERNADKDPKNSKKGTSQMKGNEAALTIVCSTCRHPFVSFVYSSWCFINQSFSIVAYYTCTCVSDLKYLSKPTSTMVASYFQS